MKDALRVTVMGRAGAVVVKIGSDVVSTDKGTLNRRRVFALAEQIHQVRQTGRQVVVVASGAIAAGQSVLRLAERPKDLPHLQAAAAIGQSWLMHAYDDSLRKHGHPTAQILVTRDDFDDRTRYLNIRNTLLAALDMGAVPIINENDTVSVDEIRFGDNDMIAAMVSNLILAPLLVMLTSADGLYRIENGQRRALELVEQIDDSVLDLATEEKSRHGTGGMRSKLLAARRVTDAGECVIIANHRRRRVLVDIIDGHNVGTLFLPSGETMTGRKRWIGLTARPQGRLVLDDGARRALAKGGKSLLAIGIVDVRGRFRKGAVVALCDRSGVEFARGLTNYRSEDVDRIKGLRSSQFAGVLGDRPYDEVVHRDNLTVLNRVR
jgi:glutamate 5-kinase